MIFIISDLGFSQSYKTIIIKTAYNTFIINLSAVLLIDKNNYSIYNADILYSIPGGKLCLN